MDFWPETSYIKIKGGCVFLCFFHPYFLSQQTNSTFWVTFFVTKSPQLFRETFSKLPSGKVEEAPLEAKDARPRVDAFGKGSTSTGGCDVK